MTYVWASSLANFAALHPQIEYHLERPLDLYSASEIETFVRRSVRLENNWTSETPRFRTRELPEEVNAKRFALVPGGRWLFSGTTDRSGIVRYYDLDASELNPQILLRPSDPVEISNCQNIVISASRIDQSCLCEIVITSQSPGKLTIYRITLD